MRLVGLFTVLLVASACATPPRTTELPMIGAEPRYAWAGDAAGSSEDTLIIMSASGGGTRAAALTLGTLRALDGARLAGGDHTLLDEVDLISSVSGGSVTAAYFALRGADGFDQLERDFLRRNGIGQLILRALNPLNLARLPTNSFSRLDVLIDYFEDSLFGETTYQALIGRRPYLILNAADMSGGTVFSFTQPQFDLICADLVAFRLAEAVAASAAFPVALAPLAIRNHSPCAAQDAQARAQQPRWPPVWLQNAVATPIYDNPVRVRRGRAASTYLNLDCGTEFDPNACAPMPEEERRRWVHLLDGGIADNLGLSEPIRLVSSVDVSPRFLNRIFAGEIARLGFVVVNARSEADSELDRSGDTPGLLKMLDAATGSSIDAATFGMLDRLSALTKDLIVLRAEAIGFAEFIDNARDLEVFVVPVDFDYIESPECRRYFKNIATSWTLDDDEISALDEIAGALVRQAPDFEQLVGAYNAPAPDGATVADVCARLPLRVQD